jgi:hypothetical protein
MSVLKLAIPAVRMWPLLALLAVARPAYRGAVEEKNI